MLGMQAPQKRPLHPLEPGNVPDPGNSHDKPCAPTHTQKPTDQQVNNLDKIDIESCLSGNKNAYEAIIRRHQQRIIRLMWRFCREQRTCEELVQEVFVQAWLCLQDYRGDAPFDHWLSRLATFVGYRYWKMQAAEKKHLSPEPAEFAATQPESEQDLAAVAALIHSLLQRLRPDDRLILTLMYFEQCTIKEIARRMSWTQTSTKVRAFRARKRLKELAEQHKFLEKIGWIP